MKSSDALKIIKKRLEKNSVLKKAYLEEKENYAIACKIREYRIMAGLTQKQLAQLIGSKQSVISRLESAEYTGHSLALLKKISGALHVPLTSLMSDENENTLKMTLHIPSIIHRADYFMNWMPNQIMNKKSYAR